MRNKLKCFISTVLCVTMLFGLVPLNSYAAESTFDKVEAGEETIVEKTGWNKEGDDWYYYDGNGAMVIGWKFIGSKWYYMDSDGKMVTGKQNIENTTYYFAPDGAMMTGWLQENGNWYYLNPSGLKAVGWLKVDSCWYYLDSTGKMLTGWQKIDKFWYYFNSSGQMVEKWRWIGSAWYYFNASGQMVTGWRWIDGGWYYFDASGAMQKDKWIGNYYLESSGKMATNKWIGSYYVDGSGAWVPGKVPTRQEKYNQALQVAREIAAFVDQNVTGNSDLERVNLAAAIVYEFCLNGRYTTEGPNYDQAYGVFIAGEFSCAGSTRALGMVLECMGYSWRHANENQWTHQWCELTMDGQAGWADGAAGMAGYGRYEDWWQ